jgi:hypothetical protein
MALLLFNSAVEGSAACGRTDGTALQQSKSGIATVLASGTRIWYRGQKLEAHIKEENIFSGKFLQWAICC